MKLREFREIIVDHEASLRVRAAQNIAALVARAVDIVDEDRFLTAPVIETIESPSNKVQLVRNEVELQRLLDEDERNYV